MCMGFAKDIKAWVCLAEQNQRDGMLQAWAESMADVGSPALTLSGIPFTGPIFEKVTIEGSKVVVSFEKGSLFGGLMVGSKGMQKDSDYVEPARPTPGAKLNHFRVCGQDQ